MEIRHLEYFMEVARYLNFTKTAERTHISQPTLSRTIKELEEELGVQLFRRTKHEVRLTDAGAAFLPLAREQVVAFHNLEGFGKGDDQKLCGTIYIGIPLITANTAISAILGDFKQAYPNIKVSLLETGPKHIAKLLQDGLLDFGIFNPRGNPEFQREWMEQDTHSVVLPKNHPLARLEQVDYPDLRSEAIIIYTEEYVLHDKILRGFAEHHIQPHILLETMQHDLMLSMVEHNNWVAFLPSKFCSKLKRYGYDLTFRPFADPNLTLHLALNSLKAAQCSREAALFQKFFRQWLADHGQKG